MSAIKRYLNNELNPTWETVSDAFELLPTELLNQGFSLEIGEESWIIIYYLPHYGYLVTVCPINDKEHFTLIDSSLGSSCVEVWCAGDYMFRPRYVFVHFDKACQALKQYYDTGKIDSQLEWKRDTDSWCLD